MYYSEDGKKAFDVKIAYIGGGSRGWAWGLMSDLVAADDMNGTVYLYDIDKEASQKNEIIGNKYNQAEGAKSHWDYKVSDTLEDCLKDANFVVISILPGTFDEMDSDVHCPEKYGMYQSVGDTVGAGGIVRALRTVPMFEVIAEAIKNTCPNAWVINYTNPMTLCVKTLYRVFPQIKAFGCCHEVFGTQQLLAHALEEFCGIPNVKRQDIKTNVIGINHFTWLTSAQYKNINLFEVYKKLVDKYYETGIKQGTDENWVNKAWTKAERIKMDLFRRYGYIAAAGDRHLAEFVPSSWYMKNPEQVESWKYALTSVSWRKEDLKSRLQKSDDLISGKEEIKLCETGEDGVNQMRALLGLEDMITNVNIPNVGQIPNLPMGAVVETNAIFRSDEVRAVAAGNVPEEIYGMVARIVGEQETMNKACAERNLDMVFGAFVNDPQINLELGDAKALFDEMVANTKKYLKDWF